MLLRHQIPLAVEILVHGFECERDSAFVQSPVAAGEFVDPTRNKVLADAGTGVVTTVIEEMVRIGLVSGDVCPVFGTGGMAIGYRLSEKGQSLQGCREKIEQHFRPQVRVPAGMLDSDAESAINLLGEEAHRALEAECPLAGIVICGRIIESIVLATALREDVLDGRQPMGFNAILNRLKGRGYRFKEPVLQAMALVATYRNETAHAQAITVDDARATLDTRFPTLEEGEGVLLLTKGILERLAPADE